jgi:hypothetical protein
MSKTAYIVGGYGSAGSGQIAYRIAWILHTHFDYHCVIVTTDSRQSYDTSCAIFEHPICFDSVEITELAMLVQPQDLLISNPANSHHFLGGRLTCRKIMYVQAYTSFTILDGFFDNYVAVSHFVHHFLRFEYGINAAIIPPFARAECVPKNLIPWQERPPHKIMVMGKLFFAELLQLFRDRMAKKYPHIPIELNLIERFSKTQPELLQLMAEHRYFMQLSPCEGFGLTPLEAMACGCVTLGFHGNGSLDYLRPLHHKNLDFLYQHNSGMVAYPQMDKLCNNVAYLLSHSETAKRISSRGNSLIHQFSVENFDHNWVNYFNNFLNSQ